MENNFEIFLKYAPEKESLAFTEITITFLEPCQLLKNLSLWFLSRPDTDIICNMGIEYGRNYPKLSEIQTGCKFHIIHAVK